MKSANFKYPLFQILFASTVLFQPITTEASTSQTPSQGGMPGTPTRSPSDKPTTPPKPKGKEYKSKPLVKERLPIMDKPFGMPGVVGWQNGKWEGNDYLGFVSNYITLSVEVLEGDSVPKVSAESLQRDATQIFTDSNLTPRAIVDEGPQLPFFHLLIIIYPSDINRYVVFANGRLFENIEVKRHDFDPKGYWQGITWETQDIATATDKDLNTVVKVSVEKVAKAFVKRYREYNPVNPENPKPVKNESLFDNDKTSN